jgi:prepilin-type N-terminal cleavage/methylation domain-containing protein
LKGRERFPFKKMITKERIELTKAARKGFTLIEILIVVAIIAILASVVLVGLGPTQQAGRDARRISDLTETQTGLELYYSACGYYPGSAEGSTPCGAFAQIQTWAALTTSLKGTPSIGISTVPSDPSANHLYLYGTSATGGAYIVAATLENGGNTVFTNYTPPGTLYTGVTTCASPVYCKTL